MHGIVTPIEIQASPQAVWAALTDFAKHPEWNPFIRSIEGLAVTGEMLSVNIRPPGGKGMRFNPLVLKAVPG